MSFKKQDLYPCNPATARGEATKLASSGDKVVYTNGRTVVVSNVGHGFLSLAETSAHGH